MSFALTVEVGDEPGTVVIVIGFQGQCIRIPLSGDDLQRFSMLFAQASMQAFTSQMLSAAQTALLEQHQGTKH